MGKTYLPDLISGLGQEPLRLGYTKRSMTFYCRCRNQLIVYAESKGERYYTKQLGMDFLKGLFGVMQEDFSRTLPQAETQEIRVVRMVGDFQLYHTILQRYLKHEELLTTPFLVDTRNRLQSSCRKKGYSQMTAGHYIKQSSYLTDCLVAQGMDDSTAVALDTANAYVGALAGFSYKTVEQYTRSLRAFFRFLSQEGIVPDDLAAKMSMVKAKKQTVIPSVWTQGELKQLVRAVDRGSPKGERNYAIILIVCRLGLHCIDIKNLCFENFNWTEKKLCSTQSRTGQLMELPLVPDVGWTMIDYLKYGRPKVDSSRIFVRHAAPFLPFAGGGHLDQLIRTYMVKAHIPMCGKYWGMHNSRHTMASVLLEKDTPPLIISDIIGHLDTNSTAVYLEVDMERPVECPLDFEEMIHLG